MGDRYDKKHQRKRPLHLISKSILSNELEECSSAAIKNIDHQLSNSISTKSYTIHDNNNKTTTTTTNNNDNNNGILIPIRNCNNLYACHTTIHCALYKNCIPCSYKIGLFDVALDSYFCSTIPNQRPEVCPRMNHQNNKYNNNNNKQQQGKNTVDNGTLGYLKKSGMKILTIGDGDFSFSLAITRMILSDERRSKKETMNVDSTELIATSYESIDTLRKVYPDIDSTINELKGLGAIVCFNVDATNIQESLISSSKQSKQHNISGSIKFDRIIWNFPCNAIENGQDGQNKEMNFNKILIKSFVLSAYKLLVYDEQRKHFGQIHMTHKTKV